MRNVTNAEEKSFYNQLYSQNTRRSEFWERVKLNSAQDKELIMMINIVKVYGTSRVQASLPPQTHEVPWAPLPLLACFIRGNKYVLPVIYFSPSSLFPTDKKILSNFFTLLCILFSPRSKGQMELKPIYVHLL